MLPKPEVPAIARKTTKHSVHILIIIVTENVGDYLIPIFFFFTSWLNLPLYIKCWNSTENVLITQCGVAMHCLLRQMLNLIKQIVINPRSIDNKHFVYKALLYWTPKLTKINLQQNITKLIKYNPIDLISFLNHIRPGLWFDKIIKNSNIIIQNPKIN